MEELLTKDILNDLDMAFNCNVSNDELDRLYDADAEQNALMDMLERTETI